MAPPRRGVPVQMRIPKPMLEQIDARCAHTGLSRAETIRRMLTWALAQPLPSDEEP